MQYVYYYFSESTIMKKTFLSLILCTLIIVNSLAQQDTQRLNIIPAPVKAEVKSGYYEMPENFRYKISGTDQSPLNLKNYLEKVFSAQEDPIQSAKVSLQINIGENPKINNQEGYLLNIDADGIKINALSEKGAFYALQTLTQLWVDPALSSHRLPFLQIEDYPRFAYRGMHLDVTRHMFPVSFIKEYIDMLAYYKLNTFHWHLTDDQGWRIEIKKYPKLTSVGAYRDQTLIGYLRDTPKQFDGERYGGFYTQNEVREVVAYAASKYITVIPEIEMPGHALAALSAYPELACGKNPGPFKAAQEWGIFEDVFCAGKEQTFDFLQDVLDEVITLFPSEYIHIGGDECPKTKWKTCEFCQKRIKNEKLKDEHELQSYFVHRIEKYLNKKGKQIIGWDEILEGGLAPHATVMSWRGIKGGIAAAQMSHNVIMTPSQYLYFDKKASKSDEEPLTIGGNLPLQTIYAYDPVPKELSSEQQKYITGVQANVWTEYIKTPEKVRYMVYPRVMALSEIAWTPLQNKNWKDFSENRAATHLAMLDKTGLTYRVPEPIGAKDTTLTGESFNISYKPPVNGAKIYYTINGKMPRDVDYLYQDGIHVNVPKGEERTLKSVVITPSGRRSVVVTTILNNK